MKRFSILTRLVAIFILVTMAIALVSCSDKVDDKAYTREGNYVYFGMYPQTEVKDAATLSSLEAQKGTLPTSNASNGWTSYGYYANGEVSEYMWYKDVTVGDAKYRAVYFEEYRPYLTSGASAPSEAYQELNGYESGKVYWFKFESIKWRVLKESDGKALLLCESIVDAQSYLNEMPAEGYANNYENSSIRAWLNDSFYKTVFNADQQGIIAETTVNNGPDSTGYFNNAYACNNTKDKIFLLSAAEVLDTACGFSSSDEADPARAKKGTDYAKAQGLWASESGDMAGSSWWLLRSADKDIDHGVREVNINGAIKGYYSDVLITYRGIAPALWIEL